MSFAAPPLSHRRFLAGSAILAATAATFPRLARAAAPVELAVGTRSIEIAGRPATVFGITRQDGGRGLPPAMPSGCG